MKVDENFYENAYLINWLESEFIQEEFIAEAQEVFYKLSIFCYNLF